MNTAAVIAGMTATVVATIVLAGFSSRVARTTGDFYVAARSVPAWWNASAISGEYLSAASFLGVAGLIMVGGADAVWFPVGYAVGYVLLLALVSAPLRRSGAYTLPDFCEARLRSSTVRLAASVLVVVIGWLYVVPQLQGAGRALQTILGTPIWLGGVLVALTVLVVIVGGGMRSVTLVQGFQYWLKLVAIMVPALFLLAAWRLDGGPSALVDEVPTFPVATTVSVGTDIVVTVDDPVRVQADGTIDGVPATGELDLTQGTHSIDSGTTHHLPRRGSRPAPVDHSRDDWRCLGPAPAGRAVTPDVPHVRPDDRAVPRDDGPAARAGPLLHEPRRAPGPSDRAHRDRPGGAVLPVALGLRDARAGLHPRAADDRADRRRRPAAAPGPGGGTARARRSPPWSAPARPRPSSRRPPA